MDENYWILVIFFLAFMPAIAVMMKKKPWFRAVLALALIIGVFQLIIYWLS